MSEERREQHNDGEPDPEELREAERGEPPTYDSASEEGTLVDGHTGSAIGEVGPGGERMDA